VPTGSFVLLGRREARPLWRGAGIAGPLATAPPRLLAQTRERTATVHGGIGPLGDEPALDEGRAVGPDPLHLPGRFDPLRDGVYVEVAGSGAARPTP
jgi:hypothetical protein